MEQLTLRLPTRGGARPGAGRKKSPHSGPPHVRRERLSPRVPVHVTVRFERGIPSMRSQVLARTVMAQISRARVRFWRVVHFSVQATHLHLVVEAENERELGRAMQGLGVRIAKSVNRVLGRRGALVAGRHHAHPLRTPREFAMRSRTLCAMPINTAPILSGWDPWSSAAWFDGWATPLGDSALRYRERVPIPVATAQTWLLSVGWKRSGPIEARVRSGGA